MNAKLLSVLILLAGLLSSHDASALGYPPQDVAKKDIPELLARLQFRAFIHPVEGHMVYIQLVMQIPTDKRRLWELGLHLQQGTNTLGFLRPECEVLTHPGLKRRYGKQPLQYARFTLAESLLTDSTLTICEVTKPLIAPQLDDDSGGSYTMNIKDFVSAPTTNVMHLP